MGEERTIAIGIGAQASGTTWLANYLAAHPQVKFPRYKEVHYFERLEELGPDGLIKSIQEREGTFGSRLWLDLRERRQFSDERRGLRRRLQAARRQGQTGHRAYLDFLATGAGPQHRVVGEYTPAYATCSEAMLAEIAGLGPDVRLIYVMRDPVEREWSSIRKAALKRNRHDRSDATRDVSERAFSLPELDSPGIHARSDYATTLSRLARVAAREKVLIMFYEEFFRARDTRPLTDFLGVDPVAGVFEERATPGIDASLSETMRARLYARLKDQYAAVESLVGHIPDEWRQTMKEAA